MSLLNGPGLDKTPRSRSLQVGFFNVSQNGGEDPVRTVRGAGYA